MFLDVLGKDEPRLAEIYRGWEGDGNERGDRNGSGLMEKKVLRAEERADGTAGPTADEGGKVMAKADHALLLGQGGDMRMSLVVAGGMRLSCGSPTSSEAEGVKNRIHPFFFLSHFCFPLFFFLWDPSERQLSQVPVSFGQVSQDVSLDM